MKTPELRGAVNQGPCSRHHSVTLDLTAQGRHHKNRAPYGRLPTRYTSDRLNTVEVGAGRILYVPGRKLSSGGCSKPRGTNPGPDQEGLTLQLKLFTDMLHSRRGGRPGGGRGLEASPAVGERSFLSFSACFRPENSWASVSEMAEGGPG